MLHPWWSLLGLLFCGLVAVNITGTKREVHCRHSSQEVPLKGLIPAVCGGCPIGAMTILGEVARVRCMWLLARNSGHSQGSDSLHNLNKCVRTGMSDMVL